MSGKRTKIIVDILMTAFLALSFVRWEGSPVFHVVVGTACALVFAIHVCIHKRWLTSVTKLCLAGKLNKAVKGKYITDVLLFAVWGVAIVTGFLAIGPYMAGIERSVFGRLHGVSARLGLMLVILHVVQHRSQIASYFRK
ncbi:MAG: hypothetical protein FWC64_12025 [Treponema sp.]|nr:hypothetical protein [Treponema sp.]